MPTLNRNGLTFTTSPRVCQIIRGLTHGFSATAEMWKANLAASQHYRVIVWDMRGHGRPITRRMQ